MTAVADITAGQNPESFQFPAAVTDIVLSEHSVERYRDRVKPALDLDQAREELLTMMANIGAFQPLKPAWAQTDLPVQVYMMLGPDICLPIRSLKAVSCLTSGWIDPATRRQRKRARQQRRQPNKRANGRPRFADSRDESRYGVGLDWAA